MKLKSLMQSIKDHFDRTKADFLKHCISLIPMLEIIFFAITKRQSQAEEEAIKFQLLQEKKNHFSQDAPPASPPRRSTRDHLLSKHQVDARQRKSDFFKSYLSLSFTEVFLFSRRSLVTITPCSCLRHLGTCDKMTCFC